MVIEIKRIKRRNKYYNAVLEDGKILEFDRWSRIDNIKTAKSRYKSNRSIIKGVSGDRLTNYIEYTDKFSRKPRDRSIEGYQVVVRGKVKDLKKPLIVRSDKVDLSTPIERPRNQALRRFYRNLAYKLGFDYEVQIGKDLVDKSKIDLDIWTVYYRKIKK